MGEGTVRCCLIVPVEIVTDDDRLGGLLTEALDQIVAETGTVGWRLQGTPHRVHPVARARGRFRLGRHCPRTPATTWPWS